MIFLHLGLHKTATTSMQSSIFPYLENIDFIGRKRKFSSSAELYIELSTYCHSKIVDFETEKELSKKLAKYSNMNDLLLSDEWFTADYSIFWGFNSAPWQMKIAKLGRIVRNLNHKVLISIRNPLDAIYSQYCEFYNVNIFKIYPEFLGYATVSNDSLVFDYLAFDTLMHQKFRDVTYLTFDEIKANSYKIKLKSYFNIEYIQELSKDNVKIKKNNLVEIELKSRYWSMFKNVIPEILKDKFKKNKFAKKINLLVTSFLIKKKIVPDFEQSEREQLKVLYHESIKFYENLLGNIK